MPRRRKKHNAASETAVEKPQPRRWRVFGYISNVSTIGPRGYIFKWLDASGCGAATVEICAGPYRPIRLSSIFWYPCSAAHRSRGAAAISSTTGTARPLKRGAGWKRRGLALRSPGLSSLSRPGLLRLENLACYFRAMATVCLSVVFCFASCLCVRGFDCRCELAN